MPCLAQRLEVQVRLQGGRAVGRQSRGHCALVEGVHRTSLRLLSARRERVVLNARVREEGQHVAGEEEEKEAEGEERTTEEQKMLSSRGVVMVVDNGLEEEVGDE